MATKVLVSAKPRADGHGNAFIDIDVNDNRIECRVIDVSDPLLIEDENNNFGINFELGGIPSVKTLVVKKIALASMNSAKIVLMDPISKLVVTNAQGPPNGLVKISESLVIFFQNPNVSLFGFHVNKLKSELESLGIQVAAKMVDLGEEFSVGKIEQALKQNLNFKSVEYYSVSTEHEDNVKLATTAYFCKLLAPFSKNF